FFFSSRRRHTRFSRDWSSDVCSSDLKRIREPQLRGTYAFHSVLEAGGHLMFGSDWYVAPLSPLLGIWAAVERQTIDGANPEGWYPEQRVTVDQALAAYTRANAFGTFAEARRGTI